MRTIGDLFSVEPEHWGLRGDRYLWCELREIFRDVSLPEAETRIHLQLENAFWDATGQSLAFCDEFFIERFAHGGMSSGYISGEFWRERGFPQIIENYKFQAQKKGR
ncbi:hypothetical protein [Aliiroseovarius sp. F47248L]|uniref:hypothetical protein n=1 Tax=Aliiroseovarius sp. F47248L TaxID=2926420 RepID=UPI001FF3327D|nr:hypothetical protein [Aliiroseovarius sp. F47248L]MCK0140022.1 hypothetical protein [Aliiroseovarius sp. F47248L]